MRAGNRRPEFIPGAGLAPGDGVSRREFLRVAGLSLAAANFAGCARPPGGEIVSLPKSPEYSEPGQTRHYATMLPRGEVVHGVVAKQVDGRPRLLEGNEEHPASLGGIDAVSQAAILDLYDGSRLRSLRRDGKIATQEAWTRELREQVDGVGKNGRFGVLVGELSSPFLVSLLREFKQQHPGSRLYRVGPTKEHALRDDGGRALRACYELREADVIISLGRDFLSDTAQGPGLTRTFAQDWRKGWRGERRLHVAESVPTLTGAKADHRREMGPQAIEVLAFALRDWIETGVGEGKASRWDWFEPMARDLQSAGTRGLVMAGEGLSAAAQEAVAACNRALGSEGKAVVYRAMDDWMDLPLEGPSQLWQDLGEGRISGLLSLYPNPVYALREEGPESEAAERISSLSWSARLGYRPDESSSAVRWELPLAHPLESWGDGLAFDGAVSIRQPLIAPLFGGVSAEEVLGQMVDRGGFSAHEQLKAYWIERYTGNDFAAFWRGGLVRGTLDRGSLDFVAREEARPVLGDVSAPSEVDEGEVILSVASPFVGDEQAFANIWLQELPHPVSKQSWGNALWVGPAMAERHGLRTGSRARLDWGEGGRIEGPVLVVPGMARGCVALPAAYGREVGTLGEGAIGVGSRELERLGRARLRSLIALNGEGELALTQSEWRSEESYLPREKLVGEESEAEEEPHHSLYPDFKYDGYAWGMSIDLDACTGCSACMVACQAENNIPAVGEKEVAVGRYMNWIRLERYEVEREDGVSQLLFQPVACVHCEKAPCEVVCPVAATTHSNEGLNEMTYNRCVGTRYCSNNCPYRARRFNFLDYRDNWGKSESLQLNTNETVRSRGVMEKCTYCVQRIEAARIRSIREDRSIRDGEIVTACQSACPAKAIVFGDLNDPDSEVSKKQRQDASYSYLAEENTRPRTRYLPTRRNPLSAGRVTEGGQG